MFWKLQIRKTKTQHCEKNGKGNKKKDLIRLQKLWKKRRDYERGVEEDINDVEDQMKLQERNKKVVEQLRKQRLITQTQHNEIIRREYHSLETDSLDNLEQSDILFLPSVSVPSQKDVEVTGAASGAQRIMIARGENEFSDTRIVVQKFAGLNCKRRLTQAKTTDSNATASAVLTPKLHSFIRSATDCAVVQLSSDSTDSQKRIM